MNEHNGQLDEQLNDNFFEDNATKTSSGKLVGAASDDGNATLPFVKPFRPDDREFDVAATSADAPTRLGRYVVRETIASGGMGVVVRAWDDVLCRDVAGKVLLRQHAGNQHLVEKFLFEARVTASLQHPGILPVHELGTIEGGRPFFVMQLIKGVSLRTILKFDFSNTSKQLNIFEQVCQTLAYCHSKGVIHLDIKPGNVMVGAFGEVHLVDWGLARICDEGSSVPVGTRNNSEEPLLTDSVGSLVATSTGQVDGTPAYMAPEQARGETLSVRSDVFGLGAMLCEILIGEPAYAGESQGKILVSAVNANLSPTLKKLDAVGDNIPMLRLAKRCLSPDPTDRPCDAGAVAAEVTAYLESMLQEGMKDWHRFLELSLDLFCIASFEGFFLRVNGNFSRVLGYPESELISRPFMDYVHEADQEPTNIAMGALLEGQPVKRFRNRYRAFNGKYLTLEWTAKSVLEERIIFAVARDVTRRR